MQSTQVCPDHNQQYLYICLTRGRNIDQRFMCEECRTINVNRLSKSEIVPIEEIKIKLVEAWGDGHQKIDPIIQEVEAFYATMKEQLLKELDEDRQLTMRLMERLKAFHLPFELDADNFNNLLYGRLDRVNPSEIQKMVDYPKGRKNEAAVKKETQILNTLKLELSKLHDKMLSLRYILLAKKIQTDFIIPQQEGESKIGGINEFSRIGGIFNSRGRMIRSMRLAYRGSEGQFLPENFLKSCRSLRNCVVLVKCDNNKIVGGYSPVPLTDGTDQEAVEDKTKTSFIFNISSIKSYSLKEGKALEYSKEAVGPCFGPDLRVSTDVTSVLGSFYQLPEGVKPETMEAKIALLQAQRSKLVEMEIWQLAF